MPGRWSIRPDLGIRLFDHADVYGFGKVRIFGKYYLKTPSVRNGFRSGPGHFIRDQVQTLYNDQSKEHIIKSAEAS